jgi:hypothetical protein
MNRRLITGCILLAALSAAGLMAADTAGDADPVARVILTGMDYPEYAEDIGALRLRDSTAEIVAESDPQYQRLSLVDVESVPYLSSGWEIYQTVSTGADMPVSVHFIVDAQENAWCFNPEIPYCSDFKLLDRWLKRGHFVPENIMQAASLARFVIEMGISTVHHPRDFLFLRLQQDFGVEHFHFIKTIDELYMPEKTLYRSEAEREEYETITARYKDRVTRTTTTEEEDGWRLHGFTYKTMRASGQLREWDVLVRRDGTVDVKMEILEDGIGELTFSWAS